MFFSRTLLLCCLPFAATTGSSSVNAPVGVHSSNSNIVPSSSKVRPTPFRILQQPALLPTTTTPPPAVVSTRGGQSKSLTLTTKSAVLFGMLLALNSGYVNGICLSGLLAHDNTKQAAAAVTGAWTNSALGVATGDKSQFLFNAKCILSYISGSVIAGVLNPNPVVFQVSRRGVGPAFGLGSILLYVSSTLANKDNMKFLYLAAIANGIQNSVTSAITANLVRTTHFSGISSDIGTFFGQVLRGNKTNLMKLKVFCLLASSFWIGGLVSYSLAVKFSAMSLLFSAGVYAAIALAITIAA